MEPERWKQIDQLLEQALEAPPESGAPSSTQLARRPGHCAARWKSCCARTSVREVSSESSAAGMVAAKQIGHGLDRNPGGPNARPL